MRSAGPGLRTTRNCRRHRCRTRHDRRSRNGGERASRQFLLSFIASVGGIGAAIMVRDRRQVAADWSPFGSGPLQRLFQIIEAIDRRSEENTSELQSLMRTSYAVL